MTTHPLLALAAIAFVAACSDSSPQQNEEAVIGPCVHFSEPALTIREARGASTNAVISEIVVSSLSIDDQAQMADQQINERSSNVVVEGDTLRCTLPCGFGSEAGQWMFLASAPGYADTAQEFAVDVISHGGGCPSGVSGTAVDVFLDEDNS